MNGIYRYIARDSVVDYLALGWLIVADLGPVHREWSVLGRWLCDCACVEPR